MKKVTGKLASISSTIGRLGRLALGKPHGTLLIKHENGTHSLKFRKTAKNQ